MDYLDGYGPKLSVVASGWGCRPADPAGSVGSATLLV